MAKGKTQTQAKIELLDREEVYIVGKKYYGALAQRIHPKASQALNLVPQDRKRRTQNIWLVKIDEAFQLMYKAPGLARAKKIGEVVNVTQTEIPVEQNTESDAA